MKIEFDIPEFERELAVSIVIRKDGEVVEVQKKATSTSSSTGKTTIKTPAPKKSTGNLMDSDMF